MEDIQKIHLLQTFLEEEDPQDVVKEAVEYYVKKLKRDANRIFYVRTSKGKVKVKGRSVIIPGFEQFQFFIHRPINEKEVNAWTISEVITGLKLKTYYAVSQKKAIQEAKEDLDRIGRDRLTKMIKEAGDVRNVGKEIENVN